MCLRRIKALVGLLLLLGGAAVPAEAAFTHVANTSRAGTSNTSQGITLAGVTSGNLLVMTIAVNNISAAVSVSSISGGATSCNGTWTKDYTYTGNASIEIWHSIAASSASCTATATLSSAQAVEQWIFEFSWTGGGTITVDKTCSGTTNPAGNPHECTAAMATTQADEASVGHTQCTNACASSVEGGGYTLATSTNPVNGEARYRVLSSTGNYNPSWTAAATEITATVGITYYANTGGGGGGAAPSSLLLLGVGL